MKQDNDIKWYIYSIDNEIKISDLKNWNFSTNYDIDKIKNTFQQEEIDFMIEWNSNYHYRFQSIVSKPYIVYYRWNIELLNQNILAIVWPRQPSQYSIELMQSLFQELRWKQIVTISWLAKWVDQLCHNLSIENNIPTIAVLWWGILNYMNWPDKYLIDKICANWWAVLSEFKVNMEPTNYTFPQRNRLIAWLADNIFLPEAWVKSWSLITVDFGLKMSKPIYGIPWNIWSAYSYWLNQYISEKKIEAVYDINLFVQQIYWTKNYKQNIKIELNEQEQEIYKLFTAQESMSIEKLIEISWKEIQDIMGILTNLELKWVIKQTSIWEYTTT